MADLNNLKKFKIRNIKILKSNIKIHLYSPKRKGKKRKLIKRKVFLKTNIFNRVSPSHGLFTNPAQPNFVFFSTGPKYTEQHKLNAQTQKIAPQSKSNGLARCLNRLSLLISAVATLSLPHLYLHSSAAAEAAGPHHSILSLVPFPSSSCDASLSSRDLLTPDKRFKNLAASFAFNRRSASFGSLFGALRSLHLLSNSSRVLSVSAGAGHGHDAHALIRSSVADVTAVDHVEFPPLVKRADPHNLPFIDGVFNLGFSAGLDAALFPMRFVEEMEWTVRKGVTVAVAVAVERAESDEELDGIKALFRRSSMVEVRNVTLVGDQMRLIVMRNNGNSP